MSGAVGRVCKETTNGESQEGSSEVFLGRTLGWGESRLRGTGICHVHPGRRKARGQGEPMSEKPHRRLFSLVILCLSFFEEGF